MKSTMNFLRVQVDTVFDHATAELQAGKQMLQNAALAGPSAMSSFVADLSMSRNNIGTAIVRSAEKPIDDRLKLRG